MSELKIKRQVFPNDYYPQLCVYENDELKLKISYEDISKARSRGCLREEYNKMINRIKEEFPGHDEYINKILAIEDE